MLPLILSRFSMLRASVAVAALFSLCVSSNVGPRFLPLPVPNSASAEVALEHQGATASRSHPEESSNFRVPMAQGQKRADREPQPRSLAVMPGVCVISINWQVTTQAIDPTISFTSTLVSAPSGRAPPDLI
jgi:hypothetical protein